MCQYILIPAYFYPTDDDDSSSSWSKMDIIAGGGIAIMNPYNGPTASVIADYTLAITQLREAGVKVIGYVYTSYGARSAANVTADVDAYYAQYTIDGIFFDEVSDQVADVPYYQELSSYVYKTAADSTVALNPGVATAEEYISIANITVVFENSADNYINHYVAPSYMDNYPTYKFAHMVHTTSSAELEQVAELSYQRGAGYVFVTEDIMPNPYDMVPSYLDTEVGDLQQLCSGARRSTALASAGPLLAVLLLVLYQALH
jgi:hypothetical protein